jgi:hypothetical protein
VPFLQLCVPAWRRHLCIVALQALADRLSSQKKQACAFVRELKTGGSGGWKKCPDLLVVWAVPHKQLQTCSDPQLWRNNGRSRLHNKWHDNNELALGCPHSLNAALVATPQLTHTPPENLRQSPFPALLFLMYLVVDSGLRQPQSPRWPILCVPSGAYTVFPLLEENLGPRDITSDAPSLQNETAVRMTRAQ